MKSLRRAKLSHEEWVNRLILLVRQNYYQNLNSSRSRTLIIMEICDDLGTFISRFKEYGTWSESSYFEEIPLPALSTDINRSALGVDNDQELFSLLNLSFQQIDDYYKWIDLIISELIVFKKQYKQLNLYTNSRYAKCPSIERFIAKVSGELERISDNFNSIPHPSQFRHILKKLKVNFKDGDINEQRINAFVFDKRCWDSVLLNLIETIFVAAAFPYVCSPVKGVEIDLKNKVNTLIELIIGEYFSIMRGYRDGTKLAHKLIQRYSNKFLLSRNIDPKAVGKTIIQSVFIEENKYKDAEEIYQLVQGELDKILVSRGKLVLRKISFFLKVVFGLFFQYFTKQVIEPLPTGGEPKWTPW